MKKFLIFCFLFFVFFPNSYGIYKNNNIKKIENKQETYLKINFVTDKKIYDIEEKIYLKMFFESKNIFKNNYQKSLQKFLQKINNDFKIIDVKKTQVIFKKDGIDIIEKFSLNFTLKPKKSGDYLIGPIFVNNKKISNQITIKIIGEKLFVGENNQKIIFNTKKQQDIKFEEKGEKLIFKKDLNKTNILLKNDKKIDISKMKDIVSIKETKQKIFPKPVSFFGIIMFVFFLFLYYLFFIYLFKKYLKQKKQILKIKKNTKKNIDYKKLFFQLEKNFSSLDKEIFYKKVGEIYRIFLDTKYKKKLSSKTLEELKYFFEDDFLKFYKKIYYREYSPFKDSLEFRENIVKELKNNLKI